MTKKETQKKVQPKWVVHQFSLMKNIDLTVGKVHWSKTSSIWHRCMPKLLYSKVWGSCSSRFKVCVEGFGFPHEAS